MGSIQTLAKSDQRKPARTKAPEVGGPTQSASKCARRMVAEPPHPGE